MTNQDTDYTYKMGNFTEGIDIVKWEDGEEQAKWLIKNGFEPQREFDVFEQVSIFSHAKKQEYIIFWSHDAIHEGMYHVIGHPSLMMFYRDFIAPVFLNCLYDELASNEAPENIRKDIREITETVSKRRGTRR